MSTAKSARIAYEANTTTEDETYSVSNAATRNLVNEFVHSLHRLGIEFDLSSPARDFFTRMRGSIRWGRFEGLLTETYLEKLRSQCDLNPRVSKLQDCHDLAVQSLYAGSNPAPAPSSEIETKALESLSVMSGQNASLESWVFSWSILGIDIGALLASVSNSGSMYVISMATQGYQRRYSLLRAHTVDGSAEHYSLPIYQCSEPYGLNGRHGVFSLANSWLGAGAFECANAMGLVIGRQSQPDQSIESLERLEASEVFEPDRSAIWFKDPTLGHELPMMQAVTADTCLMALSLPSIDRLRVLQSGYREKLCPGIEHGFVLTQKTDQISLLASRLSLIALRSVGLEQEKKVVSLAVDSEHSFLLCDGSLYGVSIPSRTSPHGCIPVSVYRIPLGSIVSEIAHELNLHRNRLGRLLCDPVFMSVLSDRVGSLVKRPDVLLNDLVKRLTFDASALLLDQILTRYQLVLTAEGFVLDVLPFVTLASDGLRDRVQELFGIDPTVADEDVIAFLSGNFVGALCEIFWIGRDELRDFSRSAQTNLSDFLLIFEAAKPHGIGQRLTDYFQNMVTARSQCDQQGVLDE